MRGNWKQIEKTKGAEKKNSGVEETDESDGKSGIDLKKTEKTG